MGQRAGIVAAVAAVCVCALCIGGCTQAKREPRALIEPVWSHDDPTPTADASAKAPPRKPIIESLLSYVPMTPFN